MEVIQGKYVNGAYVTELNVSVQEWEDILSNEAVTTLNYKEALMAFYNAPNHTASCKELSEQHYDNAKDAQKYNAWITKFGQAVVKYFNRFKVVNEKGNEIFWAVIMSSGKTNESNLFEWTLRTEIIQAIENLGWAKTWIPFYTELADKLLLYKDRRQELLDIIAEIEDKRYVDIDPFSIFSMFNKKLKDENRKKRCVYFKQIFGLQTDIPVDFAGVPCAFNTRANFFDKEGDLEEIQNLWNLFEKVINGDEYIQEYFDIVCKQKGIKWNITMGLFWIRPYDFISLDSINRKYLPKLGINVFADNQLNAENYFALNNIVKDKIERGKIKEKDIPEISYRAWKDTFKNDESRKYWLVGYSFGRENSQLERFLREGIWEGRFDEKKEFDKKQISLAKDIEEGDVIILKSSFTKGTKHDVSCLRVKAVGVVTDDVEITDIDGYMKCNCNVDYVNLDEVDFDGYGAYRQTIHKVDEKLAVVIDYVNNILGLEEKTMTKKYSKYVDLLKVSKNLVLTGAPGTGKTYMAREIAKEMGAETEFVQFHPSYDYTDFVEGLRPVEKNDGQIGFERRDGIFKEFCKRAIRNLLDSKKGVDDLIKEKSWEDKLTQFVEDAINNETIYETVSGSKFTIKDVRNRTIVVYNEQNEKTTNIVVNMDEILTLLTDDVELNIIKDIKKYFNRKFATQADSYAFAIVKEIKSIRQEFESKTVELIKEKPFVFIIDEINRGEASKIFGELFYAIDPGYRGGDENNRVKTQYQNLISESDLFANGFYVPENVYILATMNDIDRSVESMDFAMRRRFTWKEIAPNDTASMLDKLLCAEEAKARMQRLNEVIAEVDGLGKAYMIGPAYFKKLENNNGDFEALWTMNLQPLLYEYLRGFRKAEEIMKKLKDVYDGVKAEQEVTEVDNAN